MPIHILPIGVDDPRRRWHGVVALRLAKGEEMQ